jgi:hypothetical protein
VRVLREAFADMELPELHEIVRHVLPGYPERSWKTQADGFWVRAEPARPALSGQGWKIHVSTTPADAAECLARCAEVLLPAGVPFKFAQDMAVLTMLVSPYYERSGTGKFLTAYPGTLDDFRATISRLAEVTQGMGGPPVVSDALYRVGSPVYYRYGVFAGQHWLTEDGLAVQALSAPDGSAILDDRTRFSPPNWSPDPFPDAVRPAQRRPAKAGSALLLDGRFRITEVLKASAKGSVFGGVEIRTGRRVIIKRALKYVGASPLGGDAQTALRHEASVMEDLAGAAPVPELLALVERSDCTLLIAERVPGTDLRSWTRAGWDGRRGPPSQAHHVADRLAVALDAVHHKGYVLRDLTPANIIITTDAEVCLIDLELAARPGCPVTTDYTVGYAAPEYLARPFFGPAPDLMADLYTFGAVLYFLATGADPVFAPDESGRRAAEQAADRLELAPPGHEFSRYVAPVVAMLLAEEPAARPALGWVRGKLAGPARSRSHAPAAGDGGSEALWHRTSQQDARRVARDLLRDGERHLRAAIQGDSDRLWPAAPWRKPRNPLCQFYGDAGPLLTLAMLVDDRQDSRCRFLADIADSLMHRAASAPRLLPGLGTGQPGMLWAIWEAARGSDLADRCVTAALRLYDSAEVGLAHGLAGTGMLALRIWADTGDARLREQAVRIADELVAMSGQDVTPEAQWASGGLGFGRGLSGIAWFLLFAGQMLGHGPALDTAVAVTDAACAAITSGSGQLGTDGLGSLDLDSGAAGTGRLLVAVAGSLAHDRAARAADTLCGRFDGWVSCAPSGLGRGVAGWGEFLLDCAQVLGRQDAARRAAHLVSVLAARAVTVRGLSVVPDDSGEGHCCELYGGVSGVVWFLRRFLSGALGLWVPSATRPLAADAQLTATAGVSDAC